MKFDIDSLRTLQTVADTGSLQAAADQLCLSRSAVSWKLKRLQERTGCTLLRKDGRRVRLTDDGQELLAYGRQILDAHDAAAGGLFVGIRDAGASALEPEALTIPGSPSDP